MRFAKGLLPVPLLALASVAAAHGATITEHALPTAGAQPAALATGPGGALWFAEGGAPDIGMSTLGGTITETPGLAAPSAGVAVTPNGDVWVTEPSAQKVALLAASGALTQFAAAHGGTPAGITAVPDGTVWFTQSTPSEVVRRNGSGKLKEVVLAAGATPGAITTGPDGNLWFTESGNGGAIATVNPGANHLVEYTAGLTANSDPSSITAGPDGNLWFTESGNPGAIGRITPDGAITEYRTGLTPNSDPSSITAGPDGNLWFTESGDPGAIGRITPTGTITQDATGLTANSDPSSIVAATDGSLWFTEQAAPGRLGRLSLDSPSASAQPAAAITATSAILTGTVNPNGKPTTYRFDWGASSAYGRQAPTGGGASAGSDGTSHPVTQTLSGLLAATTYHYRLVATSAGGTTTGPDMTFSTPASTGTPPPIGPVAPGAPTAKPSIGRTAVVGVVSGTVLVRFPGSATSVALNHARTIPLGSVVDARRGVVRVTNALGHGGRTQSATVWAGRFSMTQARGSAMTTFRVLGVPACPSGGRQPHIAGRAPVNLWSKDNHGRYGTRGRNSVAAVRGTEWETIETCAGTRTVVKRGTVSVHDLHDHVTVLVRAGHSHLARP